MYRRQYAAPVNDEYALARVPGSFFAPRDYKGPKAKPRRNDHVAYIGNVHDDFRRYGPGANKVAGKAAQNTVHHLGVRFDKAKGKWVWA